MIIYLQHAEYIDAAFSKNVPPAPHGRLDPFVSIVIIFIGCTRFPDSGGLPSGYGWLPEDPRRRPARSGIVSEGADPGRKDQRRCGDQKGLWLASVSSWSTLAFCPPAFMISIRLRPYPRTP